MQQQGWIQCPRCGQATSTVGYACQVCGTPFQMSAPAAQLGYASPYQPQKSSGGIGALGIILIILGIFVFLGAIVGIGAFFVFARAADDYSSSSSPYSSPTPVPTGTTARGPYSDAVGRYTVDFPGTPNIETSTDDTELGKVTLHEAKYEASKNLAYAVNYTDFPIGSRAFNTDAALDGAVDGAAKGEGGIVLYKTKIKLGTVPGRDFQVKVSDPVQPFRICSRVFQDGARQYQVLVLVSESQYLSNKSDIDAFLTSFKID